jgi:hypothetical protein
MLPLPELAIPLKTALTLGFYVTVAVYALFTFVMYYHWSEYSLDDTVTKITLTFYLLTTLPLVLCLGALTFFIL